MRISMRYLGCKVGQIVIEFNWGEATARKGNARESFFEKFFFETPWCVDV